MSKSNHQSRKLIVAASELIVMHMSYADCADLLEAEARRLRKKPEIRTGICEHCPELGFDPLPQCPKCGRAK